jgi:predicted phage tail protein
MDAWTERIRGDQERRAKLAAGQAFTNLVLWGPILGFLLLSAFVPGFTALFAGPLGALIASLGMALLVGAYLISRHVLARERGFLR